MELKLQLQWQARAKLRAEGAKLWAEGAKLRAEGDKLRAEGAKLRAESAKLRAESAISWLTAVIELYGDIKLEWKWRSNKGDYACVLENGEVYEPIKDGE